MIVHNDPFIGTQLGSYEIIEAIGEGGMARIYKGYHAELNRYTAIKVINWGLQEDPEYTERFRREAQAIAILRHPNIVQIFDFGKHASGYFMVMEFIDGADLAVLLRQYRERKELLPKEQIIRLVKDVAAALDYAHSRGVVHRDIKPSNIMLTQEGQPIVTDFGLVMLPAHRSQVTLGNTFGTPHYMAPEQAISSAAASAASDVYSLGVIVYELAVGQLPFDDESPLSVALKHISDAPPPPTQLNPDLPGPVEEVILQALAKEPTDRFATAGELALTLEESWNSDHLPLKERRLVAPMLPARVPPAAAVPKMTLPSSAAVVIAPPGELPVTTIQQAEPARSKILPGWWPVALGVVATVLVGLWAVLAFYNNTSAEPIEPSSVGVVAVETPVVGPTFTTIVTTPNALDSSKVTPTLPLTPVSGGGLPATVDSSPTFTASPTPPDTATPTVTPTPTSTATPTPSPTDTAIPTPTVFFTPTSKAVVLSQPVVASNVTPTSATTQDQLNGKILFKTDRAGYVQIYAMNADGSNQRPFDDSSLYAELENQLPFSSDRHEKIVVRGEGQLDLWRANLVTGQELRVTSTGKPEYDPAWSPVDNRIVYVSEETGNGDIYMLNLDGSAVERLTTNVDNFDKHPTWSPDGRKVAYWSDTSFNKTRQIYLIDLFTKVITSLSDNPFNDWDPVWVR